MLNEPRWLKQPGEGGAGWYEVWYVVASDAKAGLGAWLRYTVDVSAAGKLVPAVWGSFFDRKDPRRTFSLRVAHDAAAIRRGPDLHIGIGDAELGPQGCRGEVEGGGHSLRWRLSFGGQGEGEDVLPGFLRPVARIRKGGFVLPRPELRLSGAIEVDGAPVELIDVPGSQAHLWGARRYPAWAWAHCANFAEDPEASLDLLSVHGPGGIWVPLFTFRWQGKVHRFGELPWIFATRSRVAAPSWHIAAHDATVSVDGVIRAESDDMVEVEYGDPDGSKRYCANSEIAHVELRVRTRSFIGAPWRPEGTLRSVGGASLEFCGQTPDSRVTRKLISTSREPPSPTETVPHEEHNAPSP